MGLAKNNIFSFSTNRIQEEHNYCKKVAMTKRAQSWLRIFAKSLNPQLISTLGAEGTKKLNTGQRDNSSQKLFLPNITASEEMKIMKNNSPQEKFSDSHDQENNDFVKDRELENIEENSTGERVSYEPCKKEKLDQESYTFDVKDMQGHKNDISSGSSDDRRKEENQFCFDNIKAGRSIKNESLQEAPLKTKVNPKNAVSKENLPFISKGLIFSVLSNIRKGEMDANNFSLSPQRAEIRN